MRSSVLFRRGDISRGDDPDGPAEIGGPEDETPAEADNVSYEESDRWFRQMADQDFGDLLADTRTNAILAWVVVGIIALVVIESAVTGDYLWAIFAVVVGLIAVTPALATGRRWEMPPWEIVLLAGLPVVGRAVATLQITSTVATYLSIAALALLIAVNLHTFTDVEMSVGFAVLFVVVATLGAAGLWAVLRWLSDVYLSTELLLVPDENGVVDRELIEERLMWEFVASGVAGLVAGLFFEGYIRRRSSSDARLEESV